MIRRPPRSTLSSSSAASDVYKRQVRSAVVATQPAHGDPDGARLAAAGGRVVAQMPGAIRKRDRHRRVLPCLEARGGAAVGGGEGEGHGVCRLVFSSDV